MRLPFNAGTGLALLVLHLLAEHCDSLTTPYKKMSALKGTTTNQLHESGVKGSTCNWRYWASCHTNTQNVVTSNVTRARLFEADFTSVTSRQWLVWQ